MASGGTIGASGSASLIEADPAFKLRHGALAQQYELQHDIGQGAHGRAILATRMEDNELVVIKQIRLCDMDDKAREESLKEVRKDECMGSSLRTCSTLDTITCASWVPKLPVNHA